MKKCLYSLYFWASIPFLPFCTPVFIGPQVVALLSFSKFSVGSETKTEKCQSQQLITSIFYMRKYHLDCSMNNGNVKEPDFSIVFPSVGSNTLFYL